MKLIRPITVADGGAFSRASTATYYDKNGVLQNAAVNIPRLNYDPNDLSQCPTWLLEDAAVENLLTRSEDLDQTPWSRGNGVTVAATNVADPLGGTRADRLASTIGQDGYTFQGFTPKGAVAHNASIWLRSTGGNVALRTFITRSAPYAVIAGPTFTVTSTWQRFDFDFTALDATGHLIQLGGGFSFTGATIEVFGAQVSSGTGVKPLLRTTGAAAAGQPMLVANSANPYSGVGWNNNGTTDMTGPVAEGIFTGATIGSNGGAWQGRSTNLGQLPAARYAVTAFYRAGTSGRVWVTVAAGAGNEAWITGPVDAPLGFAIGLLSIVSQPEVIGPNANGVYRVSYVFETSSPSAHFLGLGTGSTVVGETVTVLGAQAEPEAPSSFYVSGALPDYRAADVNTAMLVSNAPEPAASDGAAWSAAELVAKGERRYVLSTHKVYEALIGGARAAVTFTASNANASVNWSNHGLANGTPIAFVNAGGALPGAITPGATYYVVGAAANTFGVAATINGAGVTLATAGTGVHTGQSNPNYGKDPSLAANAAYWVTVGPTNRWAMFDQLSNTVTTESDVLAAMIDVDDRIDTVALLNVNAASARVIVTDAAAGVVYDEVHSLVSTDGVDNAWDWCFSPIERVADLTIEDLPPYYSPSVQVVLQAPGETPSCGMCLMGLSYLIGGTQYGAQVGIQDYSVKSIDDFGNIEITPRSYAKRGTFSARFPKGRTDSVVKRLTEFRTTPALWLGSGAYQSTAIFGFYKDFSVLIDQLSHSLCEIEIEGLT